MVWYALMFNKDRDVSFENELNMTEYLASFINNEAVKQTREARESQKIIPDQDFEQILREQFGRDLSPDAMARATRADVSEQKPPTKGRNRKRLEAPEAVPQEKKKGSVSISDLKKYTGLDLDEVNFIPKKK